MKITGFDLDAIHVNHRGDWIFVHVNTDEGIRGIGELRAGKNYGKRVAAVRRLEEKLMGRDPRQIERIVREFSRGATEQDQRSALGREIARVLRESLRVPVDRDGLCGLSAVEQALWDMLGKSLGVPVYTLLGGACREEIRLYANINRATTERTPQGFARSAAAAVAEGFDAIKLAPFDGMARDVDRAVDAADGIACMQAVRQAIGPEVDLLIDCHSHFTVRGALEVADALRELDLFWYEQPTPETDLDRCVQVKRECGMTVAGGEGRMLRNGFWEVLERQAMHVIMPDVTVIGGIAELKKTAAMAEVWDVPTAPHGPFGPVTIAAGVQAMAAHPHFLILEFGWGEVPWRAELTLPNERIENGRIALSELPGLGVELNPEVVEEHRVPLE